MCEYGDERVIFALLSYSHTIGIGAILSTIKYRLKKDFQQEMMDRYIVKSLNILMQNTAVLAGYYSNGESGAYIDMEYDDIVNPKPRKEQKRGQATKSIREKLR